ncbi:MAG: hypothetical protein RLZZ450_1607 [Pseudomonadota bacterium]
MRINRIVGVTAWLGVVLLGCSDGLPPDKTRDEAGASVSADGSVGLPVANDSGVGSLQNDAAVATGPTSGSGSPAASGDAATASGPDGGTTSPDAGATPGASTRPVGDPTLARGPGARKGGDVAPSIACADLSGYYLDNAASVGFLPAAPIDSATTCGPDTLYEPNERPQQACAVPLAKWVESEFSSTTDVADYYKIDVQKGVTYTLELVRQGNLYRAVTMPVGEQTATLIGNGQFFGGGTSHEEFTPSLGGSVLVSFTGGSKYKFSVYPSTAGGLTHDALTYEPNNSASTAAPVCVGVPVQAEFTPPEDDVDNYTFQLEKGLTYTLKITRRGDLLSTLITKVGGETLTWIATQKFYGGGTSYQEIVPTTSGPALLTLSGAGYEFVIQPSTASGLLHDAVTFEPNDSASTYAPIELNQLYTSEFSSADDLSDLFGVLVEAGATYELNVTRQGDLSREIIMPVGSEILHPLGAGKLYGGGMENPTFVAPTSGRVLLHFWGGSKYSFKVTKL